MVIQELIKVIALPEKVNASLKDSVLDISGPNGRITRAFAHPQVELHLEEGKISVFSKHATKREKKMIGSFFSHIKNMVSGGNFEKADKTTGDFKYARTRLLDPAITSFPRVETVITESTYGSKSDVLPPRIQSEEELINIIGKTIERGGKVLIPELGLGRAQESMLVLEDAMRTEK